MDYYTNNVLRERRDEVAVPHVYTAWNAAGALIEGPRVYTAAENLDADARALKASQDANKVLIETALSDALVTLQTVIDTANTTINASPASYIKDLAKVQRRAIRLLIRRLDGAA